jgi:hypothetical protein
MVSARQTSLMKLYLPKSWAPWFCTEKSSPRSEVRKVLVLYLSSMTMASPSCSIQRSTCSGLVLSGTLTGRSSRTAARGRHLWTSQAKACWKSASEWKTGRCPGNARRT